MHRKIKIKAVFDDLALPHDSFGFVAMKGLQNAIQNLFFSAKNQKFSEPIFLKQAKRLKSCERRPEVDRLDGQWTQWSIGLMVENENENEK